MAKKTVNVENNIEAVENSETNGFLDKTDKKWILSKNENKVTLCESIDEIVSGKEL